MITNDWIQMKIPLKKQKEIKETKEENIEDIPKMELIDCDLSILK